MSLHPEVTYRNSLSGDESKNRVSNHTKFVYRIIMIAGGILILLLVFVFVWNPFSIYYSTAKPVDLQDPKLSHLAREKFQELIRMHIPITPNVNAKDHVVQLPNNDGKDHVVHQLHDDGINDGKHQGGLAGTGKLTLDLLKEISKKDLHHVHDPLIKPHVQFHRRRGEVKRLHVPHPANG